MTHRRFVFLKLHVLTWLVIVLGIVAVTSLQLENRRFGPLSFGFGSGPSFSTSFVYGWPMNVLICDETTKKWPPPGSTEVRREWQTKGIFVNSAIGVVFVFSLAYSTEHWIRSRSKWQFSLSSLLVLFFVVLATLATIRYVGPFFDVSIEGDLPGYTQFAAVIVFVIVIHTMTSIAISATKNLWRCLVLRRGASNGSKFQ